MMFVMKRRNFDDLIIPLNLEFEIERYSWFTMGGPKQASIIARGSKAELFELVNHMRAPVEIYTDKGEKVWWGYINNLQITYGSINFGVDLETMFNNVAVAYTDQNIRYTTQWSGDAESIAEYGQKEILLSRSDTTETEALQQRDTYLAGSKYPVPTLSFADEMEGSARITCLGWIFTLDWQYYENLSGKEGYEITGRGGREIGEDDRPILAQSFQIASSDAWDATSIWLHVWKVGSPTDNLVVSLKADSGGVPGTTLASGTLAASEIGPNAEWIEWSLNTAVTLNPGTTYWIHIARTGAVVFEGPDYYMVDTNKNAGYPRGLVKLWNTNLNTWVVEGNDQGDLLFMVVGAQETSDQISTLVTSCGEFLQGTIMEVDSNVDSNPYRDGDSPALYELEKLLLAGTSNSRRLLCEVTENRYLRVYEEPAKPAVTRNSYALTERGDLMMKNLTHLDQERCLIADWCHLQDVIPTSVDLSMVSDPSLFFIEEAEYDVINQRYHILRTREQGNVMDLGGVIQG
jgi:hypothetical protein